MKQKEITKKEAGKVVGGQTTNYNATTIGMRKTLSYIVPWDNIRDDHSTYDTQLMAALDKVNRLSLEIQKQQFKTVKQDINSSGSTLILSLQDSFQVIDLKDLMYCESDKGYTTFYLNNGKKHLASKSLKEFEEQLVKHSFTRPHQSFIVNLKFIDRYDKSGTIHLKNGRKIPVSSRKKDGFLKCFFTAC